MMNGLGDVLNVQVFEALVVDHDLKVSAGMMWLHISMS